MEEIHKQLVEHNQVFKFRGVIKGLRGTKEGEVESEEYHVIAFDNPSKTAMTTQLSKYLELRYLMKMYEHGLSSEEIDLAMIAEATIIKPDNN